MPGWRTADPCNSSSPAHDAPYEIEKHEPRQLGHRPLPGCVPAQGRRSGTSSSRWWCFSLGEILIYPAEFAIIDRIAPEARRGAYFGAQTFAQLGVFVGPFTGGLLLAAYDGTTMFPGVGCFALAGVVIYLLVGRRIPGLGTSGPDLPVEREGGAYR
ncbi:hypothetical protein [Streptomyces adonidis]|uniref:hypothetical protein n=1 Tax=Streptomyces adonidis TaxID=3231367 RepID=UPI0034DB733D